MHELLESASAWLVDFVHQFGYLGIFIMTFLESTFVPLPAEVTMVPAGYLAYQGHMNVGLVLLFSLLGTLSGSYANYWIAKHYGRRFLKKYGTYFFFPPEQQEKLDNYFKDHGEISIFTGRLIPGLRHFISFPAGLSHMDIRKFFIYTGAGGGIWMSILIGIGYVIGGNSQLIHHYIKWITYGAIAVVVLLILLYIYRHRKLKGKA